jgi:hypothetical protein
MNTQAPLGLFKQAPLALFDAVVAGNVQAVRKARYPSQAELIQRCGSYKERHLLHENGNFSIQRRGPFPITLDDAMIILQEAKGPIKRKERYWKKDTQHKDQLRNAGKISTRHSIVGILPPLQPCTKMTCSCEDLVDDKDSQTRLRQNYVKTVKEAINNDAGNLLLLNYIVPAHHLQSRKRKVTEKTCNRFTHEVPQIEATNESRNGLIELCRDLFAALFKLGIDRMTQLQKRRMDPNECIQIKIKQCGGQHGFWQDVLDNLKAVLETEPQETSHYALSNRDNSRRYYYSGGMSLYRFWIKYLELYGTGNDALFLAQAKEKQFYPSYHQM